MAVIDPPSPLFSLNHFTFQDHTHTQTHTHVYTQGSRHTHILQECIHTHTHALRDLTWTSGHLVEEFNWPLFLPPLSRSLCLSGCHRTCQALMPSNLLPNTHCRLSFKGLLTGMTSISTPPALPLSSLSHSFSLSVCLSLSHNSLKLFLSVTQTICLFPSITQIMSLDVL